jgi:hypothetical protein
MSANKDWLSRRHEDLYEQSKQTVDYLTVDDNRIRMGFTEGTMQGQWFDQTFIPARNAFVEAYEAWLNPALRNAALVAALFDAEKLFKPLYRKLYVGFLKASPLVTDADLVSMGMPERSNGTRSVARIPDTVPAADVRMPSPAVVEIHFRNAGAGRRAKPAGVHGAEIAWAVLDNMPSSWNELTNSSFDTRTPFRLTFDGKQRGKRLYFAIRWENTRGEKGPWSDITGTVIP